MKKLQFRGLMAPVLTPFARDSSQSLKLSAIPEYAKYLANNGITGVLVNGTSGEGMSMTVEERKQVTEAWMSAVKATKQTVMVQIGGACLKDVQHLAAHSESLNVDALLCLPDLFNKPASINDLVRYLQEVAKSAPKTPLLYYHLPAYTGVNFNMPQFLSAAAEKIPTFSGAKYTHTNLEEGADCLSVHDGRLHLYLGCDQVLAGAFVLGFDSAIATTLNMLPAPSQKIQASIRNGDTVEALKQQRLLNSAIKVMTQSGVWVPAMKAAMNVMTPIDVGDPRPPLLPYQEQDLKKLKEGLSSLKLLS